MKESTIQNKIRLEAANKGGHLWRNNLGAFLDKRGIPVRYGLMNESKELNKRFKSSDLIGPTSVLIQPHHVGSVMAVFTAIECKESGWVFDPRSEHEIAQARFIELVLEAGGKAGFAQSVEDYLNIISGQEEK